MKYYSDGTPKSPPKKTRVRARRNRPQQYSVRETSERNRRSARELSVTKRPSMPAAELTWRQWAYKWRTVLGVSAAALTAALYYSQYGTTHYDALRKYAEQRGVSMTPQAAAQGETMVETAPDIVEAVVKAEHAEQPAVTPLMPNASGFNGTLDAPILVPNASGFNGTLDTPTLLQVSGTHATSGFNGTYELDGEKFGFPMYKNGINYLYRSPTKGIWSFTNSGIQGVNKLKGWIISATQSDSPVGQSYIIYDPARKAWIPALNFQVL